MPLHCPFPLRALAVAALACALSAHAQTVSPPTAPLPVRSYDIPAQPLGSSLARIAALSGQQISINADLVRGHNAPAVHGDYTAAQAARVALAGSGLELVRTESGTWALRSAATAPSAPESSSTSPATGTTMGEVRVTAQTETSPTTELTGAYTTQALTIGKMQQSIRETPQSVTVVTRQQMDDQRLTAVEDVIVQTTGTSKSQRNYGAHVYTMRGYEIPDSNYLLDGVSGSIYSPTGWVPMDTAILDRVEVLRGAGALAVGSGDPSGVVNMVRKRPRSEKHLDVGVSVGSWNNYRTEVDTGGPINEAGTLRGRVVAAYTDRKYFYDLAHSKKPLLYGVVTADLAPRTQATMGYRHEELDTDGYSIFGLPSFSNGASLGLPRSTSLGQSWNRHQAKVDDVFAELEHRFEGDWVGKATVSHSKTTLVQKIGAARGAVDPTTRTGVRFTGVEFTDSDIDGTGLDVNVSGSFNAWGRTHKIMLGTSASQIDEQSLSASTGPYMPVDVYNFNHDLIAEPAVPAYDSSAIARTTKVGLYGSMRLQLAAPLFLHLGGRVNWYHYRLRNGFTGEARSDYEENAHITPYAGLVYDITTQWSVYASYADTFQPQSQYSSIDGSKLKPAIGATYEAGVKGELLDRKLNVAFAVFNIKKRNVAVYDAANAGLCTGTSGAPADCYRSTSLLRSKGFDAEVGGQIARGLDISAGYTHLTTRDEEGESIASDAPRNLLRLSTSYTLPGAWSDWKVGANLAAQSRAYVDTVQNPGHAVLDLRVSYRIDRQWTASLNIGNVTDKVYWSAIGGTRNGAYYGTPRNATLTLRGSF